MIIYNWDKKLQKRMLILECDVIKFKKDMDFMSLAHRMHFLQDVFQMTAIVLVLVNKSLSF